jgi:aminoglycoside phosphotransferase (APT) family kinase protein
MPMPYVSKAELDAIVAQHRLSIDGPTVPIESAGVVHALWRLGSKLLLRVPKDEAMCLADHRCEAVAIPLAIDAGVRTPRLVVFDDSLELLSVPYSVVEYISGENLTDLRPIDDHYQRTYEQLGEQLALLHRPTVPSSVNPWLRMPGDSPAEAFFDEVVAAGLLHVDGVAWLRDVCSRLDGVIAEAVSPPSVLLHNDIKPDNLMIDEVGDVHLIDWGDCGYGDPADDFHALPCGLSSQPSGAIDQRQSTIDRSRQGSFEWSSPAASRRSAERPFSDPVGIAQSPPRSSTFSPSRLMNQPPGTGGPATNPEGG